MAVYKDKNGTWYVSARYTNWKGEADRKVKRGFQTKREAAELERGMGEELLPRKRRKPRYDF